MKVLDIMVPIKSVNELSPAFPSISPETDIFAMNIADIAGLPEWVGVNDEKGQVVGKVSKELLYYLIGQCGCWLLGQILDKHPEGVAAIDAGGRMFFVNDAYQQLLGVPKRNVLGRFLQKVEPGAVMLEVCKTGKPVLEKSIHVKTINRHAIVNIYPIKRGENLVAVVSIFRDVTETEELSRALNRAQGLADYFRHQLETQNVLVDGAIIGKSQEFTQAISRAMIVAKTDATTLITGENGVGKEIVAKAIHMNSVRKNKPLITVNCAAIPENLLESELFGYEEGSFTGAKKGGNLGKFELADGGTIFLDEIGDMSSTMQSKLLRVLQEKEIEKIGRRENIPIDVRVIAATNRSLKIMIKQGAFRSDLYYRLSVVPIQIPPLRERGEDILLLAQHFLQQFNKKYGKEVTMGPEILRFFRGYPWPGNVRELQNCIEHAVIMCEEGEIRFVHLPIDIYNKAEETLAEIPSPSQIVPGPLRSKMNCAEKELIEKALQVCKNNKTAVMKMLNVSRRTLYRKLKEHGLLSNE